MPRFYLIKGKAGLPVVNPHDPRPGIFLGRQAGRRMGEPCEQMVQGHPHVLDALTKGELELVAGPVVAADIAEARNALAAKSAAPKSHKTVGGDK